MWNKQQAETTARQETPLSREVGLYLYVFVCVLGNICSDILLCVFSEEVKNVYSNSSLQNYL